MMKTFKKEQFLGALFLLLLFSCKNDDEQPALPDESCKVASFSYSDSTANESGGYTVSNTEAIIDYDEGGKILSITAVNEETDCYPSGGGSKACDTFEETGGIEFTYEGDRIADVSYTGDFSSSGGAISVEYDDERLISYSMTELDEYTDEYRLIYENDRIARIENWNNYSGPAGQWALYASTRFTYNGGNVTKMETYLHSADESGRKSWRGKGLRFEPPKGGDLRISQETLAAEASISYDSKTNPFYGKLPLLFTDIFDQAYVLSKNNPVAYTFDFSGFTQSVDISYTYEDDLPVAGVAVATDSEAELIYGYIDCE